MYDNVYGDMIDLSDHRVAKLSAGRKCTSSKNIYIPGIMPGDNVCNDTILPLDGAVSPSGGK